ncbi:replication factor A protein 1-like isoform X2 [Phragmites australis]|uniref:replication factor A protein 1-like isoform X2 n=1 Tax=Phragmites australis TaxID=29695 RepID=UPI002D79F3F0|nr:replication factor A protein 1-like isoform X2 [Phragmites australis]
MAPYEQAAFQADMFPESMSEPISPCRHPFRSSMVLNTMSTFILKDINPQGRHWSICTKVSRMWDYRGGTDDGQIRHVDLVLVDAEGTAMYAEIAADNIETKKSLLTEGKIYTFRRFRVLKSKTTYRPVESEFMIDITCHTLIEENHDAPADFPLYTYSLTNFVDLPMLVGETKRFIDVIGMITEISELATIQLQNQQRPTLRRTITLKDSSNYEMKLNLWGQRASEFDSDQICQLSQDHPVIVIFVGMLMKSYKGEHLLSGNTACRWYINPEVPEVDDFFHGLGGHFHPIQRTTPIQQQQPSHSTNVELQQKTLYELLQISPYDFPGEGFRCVVTISRIDPFISWWFPSCNRCIKTSLPHENDYKCPHCACTGCTFKYKICLIGTDGTDEAEFLFFGAMGQRLVHKDVKMLMRSCHKADEIPTQITSLVSQKYLLTINVTNKCFERAHRSYQVNAINCAYGRQPTIPTVTNPTPRLTGMKRKGDSYEATTAADPSLEEPHQINIPALPQILDTNDDLADEELQDDLSKITANGNDNPSTKR